MIFKYEKIIVYLFYFDAFLLDEVDRFWGGIRDYLFLTILN